MAMAEDKAAIQAHRAGFEDLMRRKFFYIPAFEIYGGVAGLYDFGPPGCAVKANLTELWRRHFILEENMLEVSCSSLTPDVVLKTSGHVDKFTDFMVKDETTGVCYRADKLLEEFVDDEIDKGVSNDQKSKLLAAKSNADAFSQEELGNILKSLESLLLSLATRSAPRTRTTSCFRLPLAPLGNLLGTCVQRQLKAFS